MPTCPVVAPAYEDSPDRLATIDRELAIPNARVLMRNTAAYDYTGHPALAVPVRPVDGLPVSMQLVGRFYDNPLLLRIAYALERETGLAAG